MAKTKTSKSTNATLGFEQQIWEAACELWGHIPAADYRKIFTGLIFLKYISAAFEKKYTELVEEGEGFENDQTNTNQRISFLFHQKPVGHKLQNQPTHQKLEQF